MTIIAHTIVTLTGIHLLHLQGTDAALAVAFGILPDLDHIIKVPLYFKKNKFKNEHHYNWRTPLQEPVSLLWVIPFSIFMNTPVPVIFLIMHMIMDYLLSYKKKPFFPFNNMTVVGPFSKISDRSKEVILIIGTICLNLFLK